MSLGASDAAGRIGEELPFDGSGLGSDLTLRCTSNSVGLRAIGTGFLGLGTGFRVIGSGFMVSGAGSMDTRILGLEHEPGADDALKEQVQEQGHGPPLLPKHSFFQWF